MIELSKLSFSVVSTITLGDIKFPISCHIKDVPAHVEEQEDRLFIEIENGREMVIKKTIKDDYDFFYKKIIFEKLIIKIYEVVDWKLFLKIYENDEVIMNYNLFDFDNFCQFILTCGKVEINELVIAKQTIEKTQIMLKKKFLNICIKVFDVNKKFPDIILEEDEQSTYINSFKSYFNYEPIMVELQPVSEYPFGVFFPENIGKAFLDYSWREIEAKKIYLTVKNKQENFRELVKAKAMENQRKKR